MFGYVKVQRSELRLREYEYYRACYGGLCRSMGQCTGQCSRLLLNYDFAFLAHVRMALCEEKPTLKRRRCLLHPFRRRAMMEPNAQLRYCAAASAILAYEKCRDNQSDERGLRRLLAFGEGIFLHGAYRRAKKQLSPLAVSVRRHLQCLSHMEREGTVSADTPAAIFGELLGDVAAYGLEGAKQTLAKRIGFETGRFIYLLDAVDDLEQDVRKKRFNALRFAYGETLSQAQKQELHDALLRSLCDLEAAFDLLPGGNPTQREILNNILYLGMPGTLRRVLYGAECHKEESLEHQSL